ncbi:MAG: MutS-related protein [Solirubrobacteraceae bacterium]
MKAFLMNEDSDFVVALPANSDDLIADLELEVLFSAMAAGDGFLFEVAKCALLSTLTDADAIAYRQTMLKDCIANPGLVRELYSLAVDALDAQRKVFGSLFRDSPKAIVSWSVEVLGVLATFMVRLRELADEHASDAGAPGFRRFFAMLSEQLDDQYMASVTAQLAELKFGGGMLISAELGAGNRGVAYVLRRSRRLGRLQRLLDRSGHTFTVPDRDESGFRALRQLEDRGLARVANAVAQATDHVLSFFKMLRIETGFYVACLNLLDRLSELEEPTCFPEAVTGEGPILSAEGLYDVCLTLTAGRRVVGNRLAADGKTLIFITGANQGGKSTFLRATGIAQLMFGAGMFVGGDSFSADLRDGLFTHFKREEDEELESGKLDEELRRMSTIVDQIGPGGMLLCNESFSSTNEREGAGIARQVVQAMIDAGVKVLFVTHQFDLAGGFHAAGLPEALFLRAERDADRRRTFELIEGEPLVTSYGEDSFEQVFGVPLGAEVDDPVRR